MIVGTAVVRRGDYPKADDRMTLDEQARHRRRMAMVSGKAGAQGMGIDVR